MAKAARRSRTRGRPVRRSRVGSRLNSRPRSRARSSKKKRGKKRLKKVGGAAPTLADFLKSIKEKDEAITNTATATQKLQDLYDARRASAGPPSGPPLGDPPALKDLHTNLNPMSMSEYIKNLTPEGYSLTNVDFPDIRLILPIREMENLHITEDRNSNTINIPIYIFDEPDATGDYSRHNLILTYNNSDSVSSFNVDLKRWGSPESTSEQFPITLTFEKSS